MRSKSVDEKLILIVGIDSEIGHNLADTLRKKDSYKIVGTTRRKLNYQPTESLYLLDLASLESNLPKLDFHTIIICAGVTKTTTCNLEPGLAWKVNVENTIEVINRFSSLDTQVIFLSSSKVFDGGKPFYEYSDATNPIDNYGKGKLAVELFLQKNLANFAILRLTKVLSGETRFIKNWRESAAKGESIRAYGNRYLSPVGIMEVCRVVNLIIDTRSIGLFQLGGQIEQSYFEFAQSYFQGEPTQRDLVISVEDSDVFQQTFNSLASNLPEDTLHSPLP